VLLVLHGGGGTGLGMAALTGLHTRGPAAGFTAVFPDGVAHVWNDERGAPALARRAGVDDVGFLHAVLDDLAAQGIGNGVVFGVGISNGAFFTEYLARHALLPLAGVALVGGTGTAAARAAVPVPRRPTRVVAFAGTADPLVPYDGGPIAPLGRIGARRAPGPRGDAPRGVAAPAEAVAADWAKANGGSPDSARVRVSPPDVALPVTKLTWSAPGALPVELYRIDGGGHTWPGGAPYLPERIIGPVAAELDATGLVLDAFHGTR
jgi:polyhydroxybutyrate depolymerase